MITVHLMNSQRDLCHEFLHHPYVTRIGSWLACKYRVMDARGKFEEHESSKRIAPGIASLLVSRFSRALQTSCSAVDEQETGMAEKGHPPHFSRKVTNLIRRESPQLH